MKKYNLNKTVILIIIFSFININNSYTLTDKEYYNNYATLLKYHMKYNFPNGNSNIEERIFKFQGIGTQIKSEIQENTTITDFFTIYNSYINHLTDAISTPLDYDPATPSFFEHFPVGKNYNSLINKGDVYLCSPPDYSIAHPEKYPIKYRIWSSKKKNSKIDYSGFIDNDLLYDFRNSRPFKKILSTNKKGPFIYVYNFNEIRNSCEDWKLHDRILYGYTDNLKETKTDKPNKAAIYYGSLIENSNAEFLRALRVMIFTRTYLAKLRLAKHLYPAPEYNYQNGDYIISEAENGNETKMIKLIKKFSNIKKYPSKKLQKSYTKFRKTVLKMYPGDYWKGIYKLYIPIDKFIESFNNYINGKISLKKLKASGRKYNLSEIYRDMYGEMTLSNPLRNKNLLKKGLRNQYNKDYLSIALWVGSTGTDNYRFKNHISLKTQIPFFNNTKKSGTNIFYNQNVKKYETMNSGGLIYAGFVKKDDIPKKMFKYYKRSMKQLWNSALKGPFMIVSSRTYKNYGHKFFEKKARHGLIKVDITGALKDSIAHTNLIYDRDYVDQLKNLDYFYIKENIEKDKLLGEKNILNIRQIIFNKNEIDHLRYYRNKIKFRGYNSSSSTPVTQNDTEKIISKNSLVQKISTAYKKDLKSYPDLSLLRANYIDFSANGKFHSGISFIKKLKNYPDKNLIKKYRDNHKKLIKNVIIKDFTQFCGNPNLFLAYAENINELIKIYNKFYKNGSSSKGIGEDGSIFYLDNSSMKLSPENYYRSFISFDFELIDKWLDYYMLFRNDEIHASIQTYLGEMISNSRLRKKIFIDDKYIWGNTPWIEGGGSLNSKISKHQLLTSMKSDKWKKLYLRNLNSAIGNNGKHYLNNAIAINKFFPGMFRYINGNKFLIPLRGIRQKMIQSKRINTLIKSEINSTIYPFKSESYIMTRTLLRVLDDKKEDYKNEYSIEQLNRLRTVIPTEYGEFIISNGLKTGVLKKKFRKVRLKFPKEIDNLYRGLKTVR